MPRPAEFSHPTAFGHPAEPAPHDPGRHPGGAGWPNDWLRFWLAPADGRPFHLARLVAGLTVAWYLLSMALPGGDGVPALASTAGWLDPQTTAAARALPANPQTADLQVEYRVRVAPWSPGYSLSTDAVAWAAWGLGAAAASLFALGVATRWTGVLTWLALVTFGSNPVLSSWGGEGVLKVLLFYLALGYLFDGLRRPGLSAAERLFGSAQHAVWSWSRPVAEPSRALRLFGRLLQLHFALLVATTGLSKLQMSDWWSNQAFWYALNPPRTITAEGLTAARANAALTMTVLSLLGFATLAWQLCFAAFAFRRRLWWLTAGGGVAGWLGTVLIYKLPFLGPAFLAGCLAFVPAERAWGWLVRRR